MLHNKNLTEAERSDPVNLEVGDVLVFHQNAKRHKKGERIVLGDKPAPIEEASRYTVYRRDILAVAKGDILRITRNGKTIDNGHDLRNGANFIVKDFDPKGNIVLTNGWKIDKNYGHLAYGYVSTSHGSQGRSVDRVFIGESAQSFPAASREQFYVSVSRGRETTTIYTDDKDALLQAVSRSDARMSATEMVNGLQASELAMTLKRLDEARPAIGVQRDAEHERMRQDYER